MPRVGLRHMDEGTRDYTASYDYENAKSEPLAFSWIGWQRCVARYRSLSVELISHINFTDSEWYLATHHYHPIREKVSGSNLAFS